MGGAGCKVSGQWLVGGSELQTTHTLRLRIQVPEYQLASLLLRAPIPDYHFIIRYCGPLVSVLTTSQRYSKQKPSHLFMCKSKQVHVPSSSNPKPLNPKP